MTGGAEQAQKDFRSRLSRCEAPSLHSTKSHEQRELVTLDQVAAGHGDAVRLAAGDDGGRVKGDARVGHRRYRQTV